MTSHSLSIKQVRVLLDKNIEYLQTGEGRIDSSACLTESRLLHAIWPVMGRIGERIGIINRHEKQG